jgi:hypothetical protein
MDRLEKIETRKIVPIAAMVSAGKSKLLNVLFNIKFLECKAGIGTKFVNILRYNPDIEKPIFYHLLCKEQENGEYAFYKDPSSEVKVGEEAIIEENKNINNILAAKLDINYEEIFYITELNDMGFIKDKEYLLTHDLCDIPGLSEYQKANDREENKLPEESNNQKKDDDELEDFYKKAAQFGLVYKPKEPTEPEQNTDQKTNDYKGEEDDLYYKIDVEEEKSYTTEVFKRIKNYIDGAIFVLSVQNFHLIENFEIIIKLYKTINKEFHNFLIILNKIDLSSNPNNHIEMCKGLFLKYFPKCKTFNFNLNTFVPISAIQLQNELLMKTSFTHLIKYHFYNYVSNTKKEKLISGTPHCRSFIDHLLDIIKKVTGSTKKQDIESQVDIFNKSEENEKCEKEIKLVLRELKNDFRGDDLNFGISEEEISATEKGEEDDFEEDFDTETNINDDINNLKPSYIIKMIYIFFKEKKYIPPISENTNKLLNYFTMKNLKKTQVFNIKESTGITKLNLDIIKHLKVFCKEIEQTDTGNEKFKSITDELIRVIEFLKIYDVVFIPFLGPSNAGKSTIINGIIGKEILPTDLNECTKRGIIIKYSNDENPIIIKADFKEEQFLGKTNYYFEANNTVIGNGIDQVKETLKGLNYQFNEKEENSFYYIKTKIKLFDDLGFDDSLKQMIYLIDFPGFGTGNVFEKEIYNKVMSICNSFIFVVRNTVIKENTNKLMFKQIFEQAKNNKKVFISKFLKSCLFVFNNDKDQTTTQEDLDKVRNDIKYLLNHNDKDNDIIEDDDIKACFFNAKYYSNYCFNYNYFYNLKELFDMEYKNYQEAKCNLYKQPNSKEINLDNTFFDYLYKILYSKVKNEFEVKISAKQEIDKNILNAINDKINEIKEKENLNDSKYENKILQLLSFSQENISKIKTLKESGVENLRDVLSNQINCINKSKQEELRANLDNVIISLDMFFQRDFSERIKDFNKIEEFKIDMDDIKARLQLLIKKNISKAKVIEKNYIEEISNSLKSKKESLQELLKKDNKGIILEKINHEIFSSLESLNLKLKEYIEENDKNSYDLLTEANKCINKIENKSKFTIEKLKVYLSRELGSENKSLESEILNEIKNSCESLSDIIGQKGFKEWIISLFSSLNYLENVIDLIINTFREKKINLNISTISEKINDYLVGNSNKIDNWINCVTLKFNKEEEKKWKKLCQSYDIIRKEIINLKK